MALSECATASAPLRPAAVHALPAVLYAFIAPICGSNARNVFSLKTYQKANPSTTLAKPVALGLQLFCQGHGAVKPHNVLSLLR